MKRYIVMFTVLITLFFLGLLIYDFSDEIDKSVSNYTWYKIENEEMTELSFNNNKIKYVYSETKEVYDDYDSCDNFKYNSGIRLIKASCLDKRSNIYFTDINDDYIVISIDGKEKTFYKTKDKALEADFMFTNKVDKDEFEKILDINYNDFYLINEKELKTLYDNKTFKLAIINKDSNLKNALNLKHLSKKILKEDIKVILIEDIEDLESLNKHMSFFPKNIEDFNKEEIDIFEVKNKKTKIIEVINIQNYSDI